MKLHFNPESLMSGIGVNGFSSCGEVQYAFWRISRNVGYTGRVFRIHAHVRTEAMKKGRSAGLTYDLLIACDEPAMSSNASRSVETPSASFAAAT